MHRQKFLDNQEARAEQRLNALGWTRQRGITGSYWTHADYTYSLSGCALDALGLIAVPA